MPVIEDPTCEEVLDLVRSGKNLFLTGPGGTGKSTIVRQIAEQIGDTNITAMTGCAALLLDCKAKTLHSWAGIGLGKDSVEKNIASIKKKSYVKKRWTKTQTLVIDEVSMLTPELFERLDEIGRALRKQPNKPFGGLQLVLVGDFCQLPPVSKDMSGAEVELRFVFESELWANTVDTVVLLNKIWRQADPVYQKILGEVRFGEISKESEEILKGRMNTNWQDESIQPTLLFSRNYDVDKINTTNLNAITTEQKFYKASTIFEPKRWHDEGNLGEPPAKGSDSASFAISKLNQDATYAETLELRLGAQVMLITNMDMAVGLVNGSRGVIVGFEPVRGFPTVKFKNGLTRLIEPFIWWSHEFPHIGQQQIPLRVAYAITIHKSQGASIDSAIVDIGRNTFEYGQAYVALSRVRSLEGLHLFSLDISRIRTHPRVIAFYKKLSAGLVTATTTSTGNTSASASVASKKKVVVPKPTDEKKGTIFSFFSKAAPKGLQVEDEVAEAEPISSAWDLSLVDKSWLPVLKTALNKNPMLEKFITETRSNSHVYPSKIDVFSALKLPIENVKVVILGQDPYHGAGQAMGLSFSVPDDVVPPPSLKNIFKELKADTGIERTSGNLSDWVSQGVLLLNTILTVECGKPLSHANQGWEAITDALLKELVSKRSGIVFMLWGKTAQNKIPLLGSKQTILESTHPSPLSAHRGFMGCKHFSKANAELGENAIKW
jgi:ATP-dependent DNA helicase PIF1